MDFEGFRVRLPKSRPEDPLMVKGMDWGRQAREPREYSRNVIGTYLGPYVPLTNLLYSWAALLLGLPSKPLQMGVLVDVWRHHGILSSSQPVEFPLTQSSHIRRYAAGMCIYIYVHIYSHVYVYICIHMQLRRPLQKGKTARSSS